MPTIFVTNTADAGVGSLRTAIATAAAGDTIAFAPTLAGQTIGLTSGQIAIDPGKNLIIDGSAAPNLTISGSNLSRIFYLQANVVIPTSLTIRNLRLSNAYTSGQGGAILTTDEAQLTLDRVTFLNNTADQGGGAVFANWRTNVFVSNSRFENNVAVAGNNERGAGAIAFVSPGILEIRDSQFIGNRGINGAAINSLNGKLAIANSSFLNNDTTAATFDTGNPNPSLRGYGGAVYTDRASSTTETSGTIRISNSTFEGNRGRAEGGAAYLFTAAGQDNVIIDNTLFRNNAVLPLPGGNDGNGGAVTLISNGFNRGLDLRNTTFVNNSAPNQGGGLWLYDTPATITNSTFSGNQAGGGPGNDFGEVGGGLTVYNAPATIANTTFANNQAAWVGGALSANSSAVITFINSLFSNNTASNSSQILQHAAGDSFVDGGGNLQFPAKLTNFFNDKNVLPGILIANPQLSPLQVINGALVHPLLPGSPAIDAGVSGGAPAIDQAGFLRPQDGDLNGTAIVDIGAVEAPGVPVAEIAIQDGAISLIDGSVTPINFGGVLVGDTLTRSFTLLNSGTAPLNLTGLTLPVGFSLAGALPASLAGGTSTPLVIQVNTATPGTFSGSFSLTNNDSDENPFDFAIQALVKAANTPPVVATPILDQMPTVFNLFQLTIPAGTFTDVDGDLLTLTATQVGGIPLPSWLTFNPTTNTFSGTPTVGNVGTFNLNLTANDGFGGSVVDTFVVTIAPAAILPINGTNLSETLTGTGGDDRIFGFGGQDILLGNLGNDELWGGAGHDRLFGGKGDDQLHGETGNDQIYGDEGNDLLFGEAGDDLLFGGAGSDRLFGGAGNDKLTGNAGADVFVLAVGQGVDNIRDFRLGEDQIGLSNGLTYGQLSITQHSSQTWITDTTTSQLLARLDGLNAATLIAQSGTAFMTI